MGYMLTPKCQGEIWLETKKKKKKAKKERDGAVCFLVHFLSAIASGQPEGTAGRLRHPVTPHGLWRPAAEEDQHGKGIQEIDQKPLKCFQSQPRSH